ncbi:MAG: hypothetical protein ACE5I1_20820 [bacterium]
MRSKKLLLMTGLFFTLLLLSAACQKPVIRNALNNLNFNISKENIVVKSGTSFGLCVGYCRTELEVNGTEVGFKEFGWDFAGRTVPDRFYTDTISVDVWNDLVGSFDWDAFAALDSVIGCPDCADGGAEWIEVEYFGRIKKVTFEFGAEIRGIDAFSENIRQIRKDIKDHIENGRKLPKVIITDQNSDSLQQDRFALDSVYVDQDILVLDVTHSGGCREHFYALYMSPAAFKESFPVQADLYLVHNENDDPCDAIFSEVRKFDIRPIADLYRNSYGRLDKIILNIFEYYEGTPGRSIQLEYEPKESYSL